jgi:GPH family glycoside/pentoside/hexuronide:cation symporter
MHHSPNARSSPTWNAYASYGSLGFPLAALALPVYVYVPKFYVDQFGLSLSWIGLALLCTRLLDALLDPMIGVYVDRRLSWRTEGDGQGVSSLIRWAAGPLMIGFVALFMPPRILENSHLASVWLLGCLLLTYPAYSIVSIAYQTWGAVLGNLVSPIQQAQVRLRWVASREVAGLAGVIVAAGVPAVFGMPALVGVFVSSMLLALLWQAQQASALSVEGRESPNESRSQKYTAHMGYWRTLRLDVIEAVRWPHLRWLFGVYVLNGVAASIPATLFLFFVQDALGLAQYGGSYLVLYFLAGALALPLWVRCADRIGEVRAWALGMFLAMLAFVWAYGLPQSSNAAWGYAVVCVLSGMALGADLVLPSALLAGVLNHRHQGKAQGGTAFGLWNGLSKLNLALSAGLVLPILQWLGYQSQPEGALQPLPMDTPGLVALVQAYALWPCVLKILALILLWMSPLRHLDVTNKRFNQGVTHED